MKDIKSIKESMMQYTGTKTIMATPMSRGEYNALRGWEVPADEDPTDLGYLVMYPSGGKPNVEGFSGYVSWSPSKPFTESYKKSGSFVDRLMIERDELHLKICKLDEFLRFSNRSDTQHELMEVQLDAMKSYYKVLNLRIKDLIRKIDRADS